MPDGPWPRQCRFPTAGKSFPHHHWMAGAAGGTWTVPNFRYLNVKIGGNHVFPECVLKGSRFTIGGTKGVLWFVCVQVRSTVNFFRKFWLWSFNTQQRWKKHDWPGPRNNRLGWSRAEFFLIVSVHVVLVIMNPMSQNDPRLSCFFRTVTANAKAEIQKNMVCSWNHAIM